MARQPILYYNSVDGKLIGGTNETLGKLKTSNAVLFKHRRPIEGSPNFEIDVDQFNSQRREATRIQQIIDEDDEILASSPSELANILGISLSDVYDKIYKVDGSPETRVYLPNGREETMSVNWKYQIYDVNGKYLCDDVEELCGLTGIKLDQIYYHLKEKTKGSDDEYVFFPYEID